MFTLTKSVISLTRSLYPNVVNKVAQFHAIGNGALNFVKEDSFLRPTTNIFTSICGFKVMGKVRRRCKDCYMVWREQRLYVICNTHRRHKQMSMVKKPENTWILSHATQSKKRPW